MLLFGDYNQPSWQSCGRTGDGLREPVTFPITASHDPWDEKKMLYDQGQLPLELDEFVTYYSLGNSRTLHQNTSVQFSSVQSSSSVVSDSLRPHELWHARPPCPSQAPGVH